MKFRHKLSKGTDNLFDEAFITDGKLLAGRASEDAQKF